MNQPYDRGTPVAVRAPRGTTLTARSWQTEAPLRMLMNNLDPEVAERPDDLVVYGGTGRAARDWPSYHAIVRSLTDLREDETLMVQSGRPVGVLRTHEWAPRVLIANSNLVGDWATWPEFRRLEQLGLTMYGQMTAGSWIYIGSQGILQGTYETLAAVAVKRFGGTLAGTLTLTGGCGGMGGAQPLAVTLNGGVCLVVDVDPARLHRRVETRYLDVVAESLDEGVELALAAKKERRALSVGVVGNSADVVPELLRRGVEIDIVTDQTSAHDPLSYLPSGVALEDWAAEAEKDPAGFTDRARESMARHVEGMVGYLDAGAEVFDYGNSIRDEARLGGYGRAFDFPGFVPAYIRPLFAEGKGPFRWAALSGDPRDIAVTDKAVLDLFPDNDHLGPLDPRRPGPRRLPGAARPHLLARARRAGRRRAAVQRARRVRGDLRAARHRARPPGLRVRGLPVPRDGVDGGRLRRHRGLAAAERPDEHRLRRDVGLDPPRRRRRYGALAPLGAGVRGGRHAAGRREARAGPVERPRYGRAPARRRRVRRRRQGRRAGRAARADAGDAVTGAGAASGLAGPGSVGSGSVGTAAAGTTAVGRLLGAIADVGRAPSGGYERFAWTAHDLTLREWFAGEAAARGLDLVTDRAGNQWAWWGDPDADGPGVVTGSHLDSVPGGGAFDGPLGVASAFAALDALRAAGVAPVRPLGIVNFSDEEGARFGLACLGSRAVTGTVGADRLLALRDGAGDSLADVLARVGRGVSTGSAAGGSTGGGAGGVRLEHYGRDPEALARVGVFVELHVEQGRYLADLPSDEAAPVAIGAAIWPHGRWRVDLAGEANHAGTTPLAHRHDPMLDLAQLITDVRAAAEHAGALATLAKVEVEPNGVNAIPSRVRAWIDTRAETEDAVLAVLGGGLAQWQPVEESWTPATVFDPALAGRLADVVGRPGSDLPAPVIGTGAGHDAGIFTAAGVPTAMLFVRNPTGVSHSPAEFAEEVDCDAGVRALTAVLADLLTSVESGAAR